MDGECRMDMVIVESKGDSAWEMKSFYYAHQCTKCGKTYPANPGEKYKDTHCVQCGRKVVE